MKPVEWLYTIGHFIIIVFGSEDEYRLLKDLRQNYDPLERPVPNSSSPLIVCMKFYLQQILDVVRSYIFINLLNLEKTFFSPKKVFNFNFLLRL